MKIRVFLLSVALALGVAGAPQSVAAPSILSMSVRQTPSASETLLTLYGTLKPNRSGTPVKIEVDTAGKWSSTRFSTKVTKVGTWKVTALATALDAKVRYRAVSVINGKALYSPIRSIVVKQQPEISDADSAQFIDLLGPGGRIHGADVSRWQHPYDKQIDFVKMYEAGMRFVFIKASDTREAADLLAVKYAAMDHHAAQAAGIYTGFYHYAVLPDVSTDEEIQRDALAQAQKVVWRLASMGGYSERDLPYALDLENKCVRYSSSGACQKYATRSAVTLWATTFLASLKEKTGRTPFLYSYASFLESSMTRTPELAQYPLWLAQYGIDPANPINQPGLKNIGCYVHSWTGANCDSQWTVWQYSSCGIAPKYGVPGYRLDLNVFRGTPSTFLDLAKGTWTPSLVDLMPQREPTVLSVINQSSTTTNKAVAFKVNVARPDNSPVVTGNVKFVFDKSTTPEIKPRQTLVRETSGVWTLALRDVPAGTFLGKIKFQDVSGTHEESVSPVTFTVAQGPTPSPKPTPSVTATKKPSTDGCKGQIKN
ncbi:MAG: lysozyme M1 (1,4-beta-N-acetylmuramidase) [Actinobacteria bacterium BACL15 MAG-120823-bin78]|jgi:lysozyme|uniref:Lysozyme M1 (1,4-beta-N-acetylmuramidase) n=2 Tax=ac1 cluster TaxID=1655545 RepID=A0A0R2PMZ4_9ACTN|nr:MAG: lysozyme M1 (1,4-beta-N-acetylmuramidase) [Actinobacteria bacterium BACL15 MAG-120823-bin78]